MQCCWHLSCILPTSAKAMAVRTGGQTMFKWAARLLLPSGLHSSESASNNRADRPEHLPPNDHSSYWDRPEYARVLNSSADIIVLML